VTIPGSFLLAGGFAEQIIGFLVRFLGLSTFLFVEPDKVSDEEVKDKDSPFLSLK